ncbi:MAG: hypothetical protein AAF561_05085 [Planctomycetota bacterium]
MTLVADIFSGWLNLALPWQIATAVVVASFVTCPILITLAAIGIRQPLGAVRKPTPAEARDDASLFSLRFAEAAETSLWLGIAIMPQRWFRLDVDATYDVYVDPVTGRYCMVDDDEAPTTVLLITFLDDGRIVKTTRSIEVGEPMRISNLHQLEVGRVEPEELARFHDLHERSVVRGQYGAFVGPRRCLVSNSPVKALAAAVDGDFASHLAARTGRMTRGGFRPGLIVCFVSVFRSLTPWRPIHLHRLRRRVRREGEALLPIVGRPRRGWPGMHWVRKAVRGARTRQIKTGC